MSETFVYHQYNDLELNATLQQATTTERKGLILYLHGGGLIYGHRNDLPQIYVDRLNHAGFSVLSLDYPFIPEVRLNTILDSLAEGIKNLQELPPLKNENFTQLIYFGRSAGAFLALQLANSKKIPKPKKIISFYGYYSLEEPLLNQSSDYYKQFQVVPFMTAHALINKEPIAQAAIEERFPIYLSFRQTGNWVKELLGRKNEAKDFSLTDDEVKLLPPTFIAASHADQDVPFSINQKLSELIPENETFFVENLPHDFDANPKLEESIACYDTLMTWLNS